MGASLDGYASDMTRVVHLGPPSERARLLYEAVLEAQLASIDAVKPGRTGEQVDTAGRELLRRLKLDHLFKHSTGHGLGLEIHEEPRLGRLSETALEPGMVITIEPGVYQEGFGGVRIEDTVLVTETGVEVLTPTKKDLLSIT
jgi:Xaa-Pro aminopeptidase